MNDVAPALKARVQKAFRDGLEQQAALKGLSEKNSPDYTDARAYGEAVGGELAEAFKQISGDDLPNGHMYYNIAEKVVVPLIDEAYAMAADYCEKTQNTLNEKAGLGIKAVRPELDPERTESIVNKLDATEKFEDAKWILDDAVQNVVSSASDTSIKANAEAQYRAGLRPKVTRDSGGKCCDWCAALDGVYYYPDVPKEVYARHNNCTCSVEYSPSEGRRQDVWSKKWQGDAEPAAILSRAEAAKANEEARDARDAERRVQRMDYHPLEHVTPYELSIGSTENTTVNRVVTGGPFDISVSDRLSVKPKAVHEYELTLKEALGLLGVPAEDIPSIVLVDTTEMGLALGRYSGVLNRLAFKYTTDDKTRLHCAVHELIHWQDYKTAVGSGEMFRTDDDFISYMCVKGKVELDRKGIDVDSAYGISGYAGKKYEEGRYDETFVELRVKNCLRR